MRMEGNSSANVSINNKDDADNLISKSGSNKDVRSIGVEQEGDTRVTTSHTIQSYSSSSSPQRVLQTGAATSSLASLENPSLLSDLEGSLSTLQTSSQQSTTDELIASKQKLLQKENLRRAMNPPKLER